MRLRISVFMLVLLAIVVLGNLPQLVSSSLLGPRQAHAQTPTNCQFPTTANPQNYAETAWQLFAASFCPTSNNPLPAGPLFVWETWPNQNQVYSGGSAQAKFGPSVLGQALRTHRQAQGKRAQPLQVSPEGCQQAPSGRFICEEVHMNPTAVSYVQIPPPPRILDQPWPTSGASRGICDCLPIDRH